MPEPMSDEQLQQIRKRLGSIVIFPEKSMDDVQMLADTAKALLAEVERLRNSLSIHRNALQKCANDTDRLEAENAATREIVQEVATKSVLSHEGDAGDNVGCPFCWGEEDWRTVEHPIDGKFIHEPTCTVLKARAIVESEGSTNGE